VERPSFRSLFSFWEGSAIPKRAPSLFVSLCRVSVAPYGESFLGFFEAVHASDGAQCLGGGLVPWVFNLLSVVCCGG